MRDRLPLAEAKAHFAELVRRAEGGETVTLTRHGRPVARLEPVGLESPRRSGDAGAPRGREASAAAVEVREAEAPYGAAMPATVRNVAPESRRELLEQLLEESIWPRLPPDQLGAAPTKREREEILGYREDDA